MKIKFQKLSLAEAKRIITDYDNLNDSDFQSMVDKWLNHEIVSDYNESYNEFRKELLKVYDEAFAENGNSRSYMVDLKVGLKLYEMLFPGNDFTIVQANDDDLWRFISVKVMPDITYMRYPTPAAGDIRIAKKRFYSHTRRIWLKTLWWYIHLSWQGTYEKTYEVLKNNHIDNINKLIETPGRGYRVSLFRAMMLEYAKIAPHKSNDFAAFTKLNNAKCVLTEPCLTVGGEKIYAQNLFKELAMKG